MRLLALLEGWGLFAVSMWLCKSQGFFDDATFHPFSVGTISIGITIILCTLGYVINELSEGR